MQAWGLDPRWREESPERFEASWLAIPEEVREQWRRQSLRRVHEELDRGHGSVALKDSDARVVLHDGLMHFHPSRWWLFDGVIMPNHVHLIVKMREGFELEEVLGSVKKFSSRRIRGQVANREDLPKKALWQKESYDRLIRDEEELAAFRRYIAKNPQRAGLREGEFMVWEGVWKR